MFLLLISSKIVKSEYTTTPLESFNGYSYRYAIFSLYNLSAIIFSDFGVYNLLKNKTDIPLHVSTQTNTLNSDAVKFWRDLGAKRVILARELSKEQIIEIRKNVPNIELEIFIHGAQCMSF